MADRSFCVVKKRFAHLPLYESSRLPRSTDTENDHLRGTKPGDGPKGGAASLSFLQRGFPASLEAYLRPGSKAAAFMT